MTEIEKIADLGRKMIGDIREKKLNEEETVEFINDELNSFRQYNKVKKEEDTDEPK